MINEGKLILELELELEKLKEAVDKLIYNNTSPMTNFPRPRRFYFCKHITWPRYYRSYREIEIGKQITFTYSLFDERDRKEVVKRIINCSGQDPKKLLRALRRIQAAVAWCKARAEGRKRDAQEILRQQEQSRAAKILETEIVLRVLSGE